MKLSIKPITQTFKLSADESGNTTITVRQATSGDLIHMGEIFGDQTQIWDDDAYGTIQMKRKWNPMAIERERAFLTLIGADLEDEETDNPIFRFKEGKNGSRLAMSRTEFINAWDALPPEISKEIHDYILVVNPQWNPKSEGE